MNDKGHHDIFDHYSDPESDSSKYENCPFQGCYIKEVRFPDGSVKTRNPHLSGVKNDFLYHLGFGTDDNLEEKFGDVKFVCMGGTPQRMEAFAYHVAEQIGFKLPPDGKLEDLSQRGQRYSMYKVGPVISVSHGMGISSVSILLHEMIKLMAHAKVKDPVFFRLGTSGGLGVKPGTVVVTNDAVDGTLSREYQRPILGRIVKKSAVLDVKFAKYLTTLVEPSDDFDVINGGTMCASDFYEEQARLDGAFCDFSESDKMTFLRNLQKNGVVNIEMEAIPFAAMTYEAGIRAADLCVTFLDRLQGDQVLTPKEVLTQWQARPQIIVGRYVRQYLEKKGQLPYI